MAVAGRDDVRYFHNSGPCDRRVFEEEDFSMKASVAAAAAPVAAAEARVAAAAAPVAAPNVGCDVAALASVLEAAGDRCIRLFVAGAVTHIGKTTVCLSILAALRAAGVKASQLAYVKPATQCEAPDLLKAWCEAEGVEYVSGEQAPLVFYQGFTRSFLAGEQNTSAWWLEKIAARVDELSRGRRVVVVDGVGFPAVGSIVGVDNADVAKVSRAPVLLVCPSGVGAAVDSFTLNSTFFAARGVPVIGAVFNMGDLDGFNAWEKCAEMIERWFVLNPSRRERYYGVIPLAPDLKGLRERISETAAEQISRLASVNAAHFAAHVDLAGIVHDAMFDPWNQRAGVPPPKRPRLTATQVVPQAAQTAPAKSREEVAAAAQKQGARRGGG